MPGGKSELSGIKGLAIASFDAPLNEPGPCAHKSGDGVSWRRPRKLPDVPGMVEAAESGRGAGLNSAAFAFSSRGEERGLAGKLVARNAGGLCGKVGEELGELVMGALMYEVLL